jgi:SAM-dependent methyltransferase
MFLLIKYWLRVFLIKIYILVKKFFSYRNLSGFKDQKFLKLQISRFFEHLGLDNSLTHTKYLLPLIVDLSGIDEKSRILIIGPCNNKELNAFVKFGFQNFDAIDLVSTDFRIKVMDMHNLNFQDEMFDVVYSTNVIHCTKDPKSLGRELYRVTKKGGYLVLGVTVELSYDDPIYFTDYKTSEGIISILPNNVKLLYDKSVEPQCEENPHGNKFIKIIAQK